MEQKRERGHFTTDMLVVLQQQMLFSSEPNKVVVKPLLPGGREEGMGVVRRARVGLILKVPNGSAASVPGHFTRTV